jgi:hypothetical protein
LLTANGNYSLKSQSDLKLFAKFQIEEFSAYMPDINLETNGMLRARLWGKPDSLSFESVTETGFNQVR